MEAHAPDCSRAYPNALLLARQGLARRTGSREQVAVSTDGCCRLRGLAAVRAVPQLHHRFLRLPDPAPEDDHTDTTIPHKLFHYMLLRRPVCYDRLPAAQADRGGDRLRLVVASGDQEALARAIGESCRPGAARGDGRRRERGRPGAL